MYMIHYHLKFPEEFYCQEIRSYEKNCNCRMKNTIVYQFISHPYLIHCGVL